ncbi:diguanylate cyclase (GGDEF)-like protein [Mesorhizobium sangaii]|uniref:Diguanylate cyclase (GGDEF)-like protein n=2 Tax=Mesorhizobium sangaii TaxID=505389 RepID=A0A841PKP4_9HYPH|nr:diguanylate cyclase (GGDEF)-like protein [Mesorhizobium sangaii]
MLIDLDGFKSVNDTYGHRTGDELLVRIARRIEEEAPEGATLARIGGDEFVPADRQTLHELGCRIAQGFLFSKAVPLSQALDVAVKEHAKEL